MRCAVTAIFTMTLLLVPRVAQASTWAKGGINFPARCFANEIKRCRSRRIVSPDGQKFVEINYEKVVLSDAGDDFVLSAGLDVVTKDGKRRGIGARGLVEQEVLWSPDSTSLFINGSDGGEGPDYIFVYRLGEADSHPLNVLPARSDMLQSFPPCKAADADPKDCALLAEQPEWINFSALAWTRGASAVVVMAEMPCSSRFGGIMCQVLGYEIEASSGRILRRMQAKEFARRWQHSMAWKFHVPDPPEYKTDLG